MARPSLSIRMARSAIAALLGAIEIYNKPTVEYREQTFAILLVNAWEVLLKARIVQKNGNKVGSILERKDGSRRLARDGITGGKSTINLHRALSTAGISGNVRKNIEEIVNVRNEAIHIGFISDQRLRDQILEFGAASVTNFIKLCDEWFSEVIHVPYLLPVGFTGDAQLAISPKSTQQRMLLKRLQEVATSASTEQDDYHVSLSVEVTITPQKTGGGTIGPTHDPSAPRVNLSTDEMLELYPCSYDDIKDSCRSRYVNFKANQKFNNLMKTVKSEANCAHFRPSNPRGNKQYGQYYYNWSETAKILDRHYQMG